MKNKILSVLITASLAISSSAIIFANNNIDLSHNQQSQDIQVVFEDENGNQNDISFYSDNYDVNKKKITSKNKNGTFTPTYKYMKAFFSNESDGDVNVYIQDGNGSTLTNGSFSAPKGDNGRSELMTVDNPGIKYKFNISSDGGGTTVKGKLTIRTATTKDELK